MEKFSSLDVHVCRFDCNYFTLSYACSPRGSAACFIIAHNNNTTKQTATLLKFEILFISNFSFDRGPMWGQPKVNISQKPPPGDS